MNFSAMLETLPVMGEGMLGIFAVSAVMIGTIYLLDICFKDKKDK
ncbi:MAG TPA: hypothetical protein PLT66_00835 [Bacillota bacterium]|nr:hypothetical protein [Bacillota bacterium]